LDPWFVFTKLFYYVLTEPIKINMNFIKILFSLISKMILVKIVFVNINCLYEKVLKEAFLSFTNTYPLSHSYKQFYKLNLLFVALKDG
jgi:hypothetical protein